MKQVLLVVAGIVACLVVFFLLFPVFSETPANPWTEALSDTKQCAIAVSLYLADSEDRFPQVDRWFAAVEPYLKSKSLLSSRIDNKTTVSRAMNALLDSVKVRHTQSASDLVVLFTVPGPTMDAWGGPGGGVEGKGEQHRAPVAFFDTHCKQVPRAELTGLRWRP